MSDTCHYCQSIDPPRAIVRNPFGFVAKDGRKRIMIHFKCNSCKTKWDEVFEYEGTINVDGPNS